MADNEQSSDTRIIKRLWASFAASAAKRPYLALIFTVLAFVLAIIPPLAAFGAVLSVALLFAVALLQQEGVQQKFAPFAKFLAAIGLVFGLVINATYSPGHDRDLAESTSAQASQTQQVAVADGKLSLFIALDDAASGIDEVKIGLEGKTSNGKAVKESLDVAPGHSKELDLGAGEYTFTYNPDSQADKTTLCKYRSHSIEFSAVEDKTLRIGLEGDEAAAAAAAAKAEEARVAAEQKAAEEAAEKQRQQEEVQQAAAREAAEREAAEQAVKAQNTAEATVYIAASGNGKRYHSNPNCSNMKGTVSLSVSAAQARGYTPCQKCY